MFSFKNKIDPNLKHAIENKLYKNYRVNIYCKSLQENIEKKVKTYKGQLIRSIYSINLICAYLTANSIQRFIEYPEVEYITLDSFALLCGTSVLSANGVRFQEKYRLTGKGVGIGLIDSGVYPHPDLVNPYNRIKTFIDLINEHKYPYDDNGHGTFVSGILCGNGQLSKGMYRGIAESSSIHCIKAFNGNGRGYVSDVLYGIEYLIANSRDLNLKILCLPFEIINHDIYVLNDFSKLFSLAINNGIVPIVPSGSNVNVEGSMVGISTLDNCITVGGVDTRKTTISYKYSSAGPCGKLGKPDIVAACVDICSLNTNIDYISERNGLKIFTQPLEKPYTTYSGTSCAAAYITGLCALLFENNPNLTFKDILSLLKVSSILLNLPKGVQGNGVIDLQKLLP